MTSGEGHPSGPTPADDTPDARSAHDAHGAHDAHFPHETLAREIARRTGHNPARCYQCGKCSAGCPMAAETDLRPHDVLRLVGLNRRETLLSSESLWLCLGCETCTARCPNDCDPAAVIDTLRAMALSRAPKDLPRAITAFHRSFLDEIAAHGRISELGMTVRYKMKSGALFQDATAAPGMVSRGKLHLAAPKVSGVDEVGAIFKACENAGEEAKP
jgi:heterodisulfide reductase subunit C